MNEDLKDNSTGSNGVAQSDLLASLGFCEGVGFSGEVWTNPDSEWMTQVWVCLSGDFLGGELWFDARKGFNLRIFFKWWESRSSEEYFNAEAERQAGADW